MGSRRAAAVAASCCLAWLWGAAASAPARSKLATAPAGTAGRQHFAGPAAPVHDGRTLAEQGLANADCAHCHAEVAAEFAGSEHASAFTDPFFQRAFGDEPETGCRNCHAPQAAPAPNVAGEGDGVGCATCHVRDGAIVDGPAAPTAADAEPSPHKVVRAEQFGAADFCAGCHQFGFLALPRDRRPRFESADLQQTTFAEWQQRGRSATCQQCHMPVVTRVSGRGGRSHRFGGRTAEMLSGAVQVEAEAERDGGQLVAQFALRANTAGHSVPTGDLFRRLDLRLVAPDGRIAAVAHLGRQWRMVEVTGPAGQKGTGKRLVRDDRVPPTGAKSVTLRAPWQAGRWSWRLEHVRAPAMPGPGLGCGEGEACAVMAGGTLQL